MYQTGDLVIYGNTGVCRVENITTPEETPALQYLQAGCKYYILRPLYQTETIYAPIDNPKVFMRDVISREKAEALIEFIPSMHAVAYHSLKMQELKEHYEAATRTHDCANLIELVMSIHAKKQYAQEQNRKFGQVDEYYMKRAEGMLYGEFSVALDIPKEDVPAYIAERVAGLNAG